LHEKNAPQRRLRGVVQVLNEQFGPEPGSWCIQQRGALRWTTLSCPICVFLGETYKNVRKGPYEQVHGLRGNRGEGECERGAPVMSSGGSLLHRLCAIKTVLAVGKSMVDCRRQHAVSSPLGLLRTPGASLRASLRASPGRHLGVVRPERPNSKGRQQGVAKR